MNDDFETLFRRELDANLSPHLGEAARRFEASRARPMRWLVPIGIAAAIAGGVLLWPKQSLRVAPPRDLFAHARPIVTDVNFEETFDRGVVRLADDKPARLLERLRYTRQDTLYPDGTVQQQFVSPRRDLIFIDVP